LGNILTKLNVWSHQGSMLWSQFSAIFDNFRRKNWRFSQKPLLWSKFCIINFVSSQKRQFFCWNFRRKYFKNHNIGPRVARWYIWVYIFWRALEWKMLVFTMVIWYILWSFGIFCGHLVYSVVIWYILWSFGIFCGHLVYLLSFWYVVQRKIWHPWVTLLAPFLSHIWVSDT
jgi:hypothetical protein